MAEMQPVSKRVQTTREFLEKQKAQLRMALPKHLTPERLIRVVLTEVIRSAQTAPPGRTLLDCTIESFAGAVLQVAQLGLEPGVLGQAYLIPFRNTKRGVVECQLVPGYKGLLMLARRSGQIRSIDPVVVYAKDRFSIRKGTDPKIVHEPYRPKWSPPPPGATLDDLRARAVTEAPPDDAGPAVAYYAVAHLKDGGVQFETMWHAEVEAHRRRYSRASEEGPWVTNFNDMALKTVLRKLCKFLPLTVEAQTAVALDERAEAGLPQELDVLFTADGATPESDRDTRNEEVPKTPPQTSALDKAVALLKAKAAAPPSSSAESAPGSPADGAGGGPHTPDSAGPSIEEPPPPRRRRQKFPTVVETPRVEGPPPPAEPAPGPAGEPEITSTTVYDLIKTCATREALDHLEDRVLASEVWAAWPADGRRIVREAFAKQRRHLLAA